MARRVLLLSSSFAVVMVMMMGGWTSEAAISCGQVIPALAPCISYMTMSMPGVKYELVNSIPGKCGVAIPWKLSPTLDCSKVHW
ncbi:lipid transfer protein [Cinnamomum micranthum f. kanehirae]|uniref:Lipid transfer protein n=1 Tax=Cinnamomum micranthum f. kanehirae TaxID=337451 RepID=A0A3S5WGM8_9MAGN|nr:lipid transfer protein [Cinnamomum micranthum f. kanehirae]